jgi:hypothetical protein
MLIFFRWQSYPEAVPLPAALRRDVVDKDPAIPLLKVQTVPGTMIVLKQNGKAVFRLLNAGSG